MRVEPETWKRFADHDEWQRRRAAIFAFLERHTVSETAERFELSPQRVRQLIAKRKRNPKFGQAR